MLPTTGGEQPFRVLLVDRSEETRDLFAALFAGTGYEVKAVSSGSEAIAAVPAFRPHAVFTAIFLGEQNGFELCKALRRMPETAHALIVAITGHSAPDTARLAREAGFDQYLAKPVRLEALLETMQGLAGYKGKTVPVVHFSSSVH